MEPATRELVRRRAGNACEYCRIPQQATPLVSFHIEHIVARQHGGSDAPDVLALACDRCNAYKGPNLTSIDPETNAVVALFNPRTDTWGEHVTVRDGHIAGLRQKDARRPACSI
jgi:5-methylcytosine-specific restriction endonuclease McrA